MRCARGAGTAIFLLAVLAIPLAPGPGASQASRAAGAAPQGVVEAESETAPKSESETVAPHEDEPQAGRDEDRDVIEPPQADDPGDFGGCIFRERPLELLV